MVVLPKIYDNTHTMKSIATTITQDILEQHLTQLNHLSSALDLIADGIEFGEYKDHHTADAVRGVSDSIRGEIRALIDVGEE